MIGLSPQTVPFDSFCLQVESKLCRLGQLETGQFVMTRRPVLRSGKHCGMYFCIHGPRSVKLTAVYDAVSKMLIYYGADGTRRGQESVNVRMPSQPVSVPAPEVSVPAPEVSPSAPEVSPPSPQRRSA